MCCRTGKPACPRRQLQQYEWLDLDRPREPQTAPVYRITDASVAFGAAVAAGFAGTVAAAFGSAAGAGTTVAAG
jgi:hypothetical protein